MEKKSESRWKQGIFPLVATIFRVDFSQDMKSIFVEHISQLCENFRNDGRPIDKFARISQSAFLKINFDTGSLGKFWI